MTGGGDTDEFEPIEGESDDGDGSTDGDDDLNLNTNDPDPTAGASDVGGLPGDIDEAQSSDGSGVSSGGATGGARSGEDAHETGGGHTGMGKGPTGS